MEIVILTYSENAFIARHARLIILSMKIIRFKCEMEDLIVILLISAPPPLLNGNPPFHSKFIDPPTNGQKSGTD